MFVVISARVLGPEEFGIYALLLAVIEMLAVASGSGYMDYLTREAAQDQGIGWRLAGQLFWLRVVSVAPLAALALGALSIVGYGRPALMAAGWLCLSLFPRSFTEAVQGVLRGTERYGHYLAIEATFDVVLIAGAVFLSIAHSKLSTVVAIEVLAAIVVTVPAAFSARKYRVRGGTSLTLWGLLTRSVVFNLYSFVGNLYDRLDIILLSAFAGSYAAGIYAAAYRPLGTMQLLPYGILYSLLPSLSRNHNKEIERDRLERAMGLLLCLAFIAILATAAFAKVAIPLVFGAQYSGTIIALNILIWAVALRYLNFAFNTKLLAARKEAVFLLTSVVCLAVNVAGNVIFIPMYSWRAAALVTIVTEIVLLVQNVYWVRRIFGEILNPFGWRQNLAIFVFLMVITHLVTARTLHVYVGIGCLVIFGIHLYRIGMLKQVGLIWSRIDVPQLEASNS